MEIERKVGLRQVILEVELTKHSDGFFRCRDEGKGGMKDDF